MLKLESSYKHSFPKDQDFGFGPSSAESSYSGEDAHGATGDVLPCSVDVNAHISHVMNLPDEDYMEVWEVLSPRPIVTLKSVVEATLSVFWHGDGERQATAPTSSSGTDQGSSKVPYVPNTEALVVVPGLQQSQLFPLFLEIARMYQCNDASALCRELSAIKEENDDLTSSLNTSKSKLKGIQESKVALEAKVWALEGEVEIGLQTTDMFRKNVEDAQRLLLEFQRRRTML